MAGLGSTGPWGKGKDIGTHSGADLCTHMTTPFWPTPLPFGQRPVRPYARDVVPTVGPHEASQCSQPRLINQPSPPDRQYYISSRLTGASSRFPAAHRPLTWSELSAFCAIGWGASQAPFGEPPAKTAATGCAGRLLARALPPLQATDRPLPPYGRYQWREGRHPSRPRRRSSTATLCMPSSPSSHSPAVAVPAQWTIGEVCAVCSSQEVN